MYDYDVKAYVIILVSDGGGELRAERRETEGHSPAREREKEAENAPGPLANNCLSAQRKLYVLVLVLTIVCLPTLFR